MSIVAQINNSELTRAVTSIYDGRYYEVLLIDSIGLVYVPGTTPDSAVLDDEVAELYGYQREVFYYEPADVLPYADAGVGLLRKGVVYTHDGGGTGFNWTHYAVVNGNGNVIGLGLTGQFPTGGVTGLYENLDAVGSLAGKNMTVDVEILDNGAGGNSDYLITINKPGYGFQVGETVTISNETLVAIGAATAGTGDLSRSVETIYTSPGEVVAVAPLSTQATLSDGRQALLYVDTKLFGLEP